MYALIIKWNNFPDEKGQLFASNIVNVSVAMFQKFVNVCSVCFFLQKKKKKEKKWYLHKPFVDFQKYVETGLSPEGL